jgi:hypothetical protein
MRVIFDKSPAPATRAAAVVPSDSADLPGHARSLYVAGGGNVAVTTTSGDVVTFSGVPAGSILPVQIRRVHATGTSATGIVALFD